YPWRELAVSLEKKFQLPLWNPYNFSGTPLLANFQSASLYPLNILFFMFPFVASWNLMVFMGPLLSGVFLFLYLNSLKVNKWASVLGSLVFSFSGFSISWLEWGTITHTAVWLPLILLSIDKIFINLQESSKLWYFIFIFSLVSSFFAGHLQIFFYLFIFLWAYFLARWIQFGRNKKILFLFIILNSLFIILSSIQWIPTMQLISLSARNIDVESFGNPGWFVPWQHFVQFIAPDYFGNPTTLNYWGVWNYGELVGYVGIIPLILAIFAMFLRKDKKTLFFGTVLFLSLIFSFPTFFAKVPYLLKIPFLETSQPTRLIFIIDLTLAILSALGFDFLLKTKRKIFIIYPLIFVGIVLIGAWIFIPKEHMSVVKSNLFLPTLLIVLSWVLFVSLVIFQKKRLIAMIVGVTIVTVVSFDLLRFGWKFTPFTQKSYLFPSTKTLAFLQKNIGVFRIMSTDPRILPPNFSSIYRIQSVDGYDPLYLLRYAELIAASERAKPDINPPFGFNRIITPHNFESKIVDLLGVKYILGLSDLKSSKLRKVFQEGETRIYENLDVFPRAYFVPEVKMIDNKYASINLMFDKNFNAGKTAIVENVRGEESVPSLGWEIGKANVVSYSENKVIISTDNNGDGFLVLTDSFYPTWRAKIDSKETIIYRTNYNFRGIVVTSGKHEIEFYNSLF
ncbi:MAG: YfhO family protein, partial [Candidatus Levybacteria bacterium]|nr:YfhO family protein [Candidatus Levybacteria bacterium]